MVAAAMIREWISRQLFLRTLRVHRSRLNWREAGKYTAHWRKCQRLRPRNGTPKSQALAREFWWRGSVALAGGLLLDDFLRAAFRCDYTFYYAKTYRSEWTPERSGSQFYHADGGPGTCIIVMEYRSLVSDDDGPLEVVDWRRSMEIFKHEPRDLLSRDSLVEYYESCVKPSDRTVYCGGARTFIAFTNNALHRGGYPERGHTREATVYHAYPSLYGDKSARMKTESYPKDPDI